MTTPAVMRDSFAWMQARLVELLLRHDAPAFTESFGERASGPLADPKLARHRELAALWHLRRELFEEILPRVKRRLSFAAPREVGVEPLPPRGRVDWAQTAAAGLRHRPGQPPLEARTRQRRRHFGTPENVLVVVTLLEYRGAAEQLLARELASVGPTALRHPLHDIVESCDRELAFPPLAGLRAEAEGIIRAGGLAVSDLAAQVAEQQPRGRTGAYDDLIAWRERLGALRLAALKAEDDMTSALGLDPTRDDTLYETWLFYELADLLRERGSLVGLDGAGLAFSWGDGAGRRDYVLQLRPELADRWENSPTPRPSLLIERDQPQEVRSALGLIWREPGFLIAAAFAPGAGSGAHARRLLGDLQLAGGRRGTLIYAHSTDEADILSAPRAITPGAALDAAAPDTHVALLRAAPLPGDERGPWGALEQLLQETHDAIGQVVPVACHGVFLDALSVVERGALVGRDGLALTGEPGEILICPKPHVAPWRVDLVSRAQHCCQDARLCHIIGQPGASPPVRPPRTAEDLLRELGRLFETRPPDELDEGAIDAVALRVEGITRRFAELAGDFGVATYENRLRDAGMDRTLHLLGASERESLALAVYLVDKLDGVGATDFSAPTIHLARVLEREIQRRVMAIPGISKADFPHGKPTLGSLAGTRRRRPEVWERIVNHLEHAWDGRVDAGDPQFAVTVDAFVAQLQPAVQARNQAAHTTPVSRERYRGLFVDMCQGGALRVGALNALLLAWSPGGEH